MFGSLKRLVFYFFFLPVFTSFLWTNHHVKQTKDFGKELNLKIHLKAMKTIQRKRWNRNHWKTNNVYKILIMKRYGNYFHNLNILVIQCGFQITLMVWKLDVKRRSLFSREISFIYTIPNTLQLSNSLQLNSFFFLRPKKKKKVVICYFLAAGGCWQRSWNVSDRRW